MRELEAIFEVDPAFRGAATTDALRAIRQENSNSADGTPQNAKLHDLLSEVQVKVYDAIRLSTDKLRLVLAPGLDFPRPVIRNNKVAGIT